jgi:hypothetical protein
MASIELTAAGWDRASAAELAEFHRRLPPPAPAEWVEYEYAPGEEPAPIDERRVQAEARRLFRDAIRQIRHERAGARPSRPLRGSRPRGRERRVSRRRRTQARAGPDEPEPAPGLARVQNAGASL